MNSSFTITLKPEINFADLKIKNLDKLKSEIKKHIVSSNLSYSEKTIKSTLKKESANFKFSEKVEKYRMSETKRLMGKGLEFEKARKQAFMKSLMSDREKRKLEYKNLKEQGVAMGKFLKLLQNIKKNTSLKIQAMGTMLGNTATSLFSYVISTIKKGIAENTIKSLNTRFSSYVFNSGEQAAISNMLSFKRKKRDKDGNIIIGKDKKVETEDVGIRGFDTELERSDFIRKSTVLRGTLSELGIKDWGRVSKAILLSSRLKAGDIAQTNDEAISLVDDFLKGNTEALLERIKILGFQKGEDYIKKYGFEGEFKEKALSEGLTKYAYGEHKMNFLNKILEDTSHLKTYAATKIEDTGMAIRKFEDYVKDTGASLVNSTMSLIEKFISLKNTLDSTILSIKNFDIRSILPLWADKITGYSRSSPNPDKGRDKAP